MMLHKTFLTAIAFITLVCLVACEGSSKEQKKSAQDNAKMMQTVQQQKKSRFAGIQFASKSDTTCGMPITAGVEDTLVLNGKVYGFCATECKDEFAKVLKSQHKR